MLSPYQTLIIGTTAVIAKEKQSKVMLLEPNTEQVSLGHAKKRQNVYFLLFLAFFQKIADIANQPYSSGTNLTHA